jgi:hypothetical protein
MKLSVPHPGRLLLLLLPLLALGARPQRAMAQVLEPAAVPVSAEVLAQGGSFVANAQGFNALFHNPAAFSAERVSLTVLAASGWVYADPARFFRSLPRWDDPTALAQFVDGESASGGFGGGAAAGIGYVGRGLGLGASFAVDSYLWGPTSTEASGTLTADLQLVAGVALKTFGDRLRLGADVRPILRLAVPVDSVSAFDFLFALQGGGDPLSALEAAPALYGFGFGIDLGAILELGGWKVGLAVRDFLGTRIAYTQSSFGAVLEALRERGGLPTDGTAVAEDHRIPMDLSVGLAYHFDFAPRVVDPIVHLALSDLIGVLGDGRSPWNLLHLGTEVRLLRFLALRAGLNQGYLTFGAGLRAPLLEINAAFFTRELGRQHGDRPSSGLALEAALRLDRPARARKPAN